MSSKSPVVIKLESRSNGELSVHHYQGIQYPKDDCIYVRYEEPQADLMKSMTTIRIDGQSLRVVRFGATQSEHTFVPHTTTHGYMESSGVRFSLQMHTYEITQKKRQSTLVIEWAYDLTINEQAAGRYQVALYIGKDESS
jgi:uncharacterized beta-barrel protein YwiB (DUF1934 family)